MSDFPPTLIWRHRRENLKKCSLRGLEARPDIRFFSYPTQPLPPLEGYLLLTLDAKPLSIDDSGAGLLLLDATWRYAERMLSRLDAIPQEQRRSLPPICETAYPRRQEGCSDPHRGLASVEALYLAYRLLGRNPEGLLDHYYWREEFLLKLTQIAPPT